jgi:hypothetical protein
VFIPPVPETRTPPFAMTIRCPKAAPCHLPALARVTPVLIPCDQCLHGLFTLACIHPAPLNSWPTALHAGWMRAVSHGVERVGTDGIRIGRFCPRKSLELFGMGCFSGVQNRHVLDRCEPHQRSHFRARARESFFVVVVSEADGRKDSRVAPSACPSLTLVGGARRLVLPTDCRAGARRSWITAANLQRRISRGRRAGRRRGRRPWGASCRPG